MNSENVSPQPQSEKNRYTKVKEKKIAAVKRNPLSDLCENQPQKNKAVTLRKVTTKTIEIKKDPVSATAKKVEKTETNLYFQSENITKWQQENEVEDELEDEVFVDGDNYLNFVDLTQEKKQCAKSNAGVVEDLNLKQTLPVVRKNSLKSGCESQQIQKAAQKITLARRLSRRKRRYSLTQLHKDCLYDEEYFRDNLLYLQEKELNYVYRFTYLKQNVNQNYRMIVVNWLIYVGEILDITEHTFFIAVRMFDFILAKYKLPSDRYVLFAVCCLWIANKTIDVHYIKAPKLFSICNGKISRKQFFDAERDILEAVNFDTNVAEPMSFLFYLLKRESLENEPKIIWSATFVLEAFALLPEFSSLTPSLLACFALYQVFQKYDIESVSFLNYLERHVLGLEKEIFLRKSEALRVQINEVLKSKSASGELIAKYSTEEKCFVARNFTN